jgi:hypothetical protein
MDTRVRIAFLVNRSVRTLSNVRVKRVNVGDAATMIYASPTAKNAASGSGGDARANMIPPGWS